MPRRTVSLAVKFRQVTAQLEGTRSQMEMLLRKKDITIDDINHVYVGLFIEVCTHFEALIEDLFVGLVAGDLYSNGIPVKRNIIIKPASNARVAIFQGKQYLDWLPFEDRTLPRAKIYFNQGLPFSDLAKPQLNMLDRYFIIRNAIAHKSRVAKDRFQTQIQDMPLLPQEKTPAGYLRSIPNSSTGLTQYELCVLEFVGMADTICK
ncbi:MAG: hypothetical protein PHR28_06250 [candidate division Zixibacteria bacterium]|nr:hypothetical protein [candidate division Zixibacteria bacterium]